MSLERILKTLAGAPLTLGVCLLLGALFAQGAWAQLNYSQINGARAFVPVTPPSSQVVNLSSQLISGVISPPGFTFNFAGVNFSDFMIARGFIALGTVSAPSQAQVFDLALHHCLIAPCGTGDLRYGSGSETSWQFQGGLLTVQWLNMLELEAVAGSGNPPLVSCQVILNTATGTIEFSYSANAGGPFFPRSYGDIAAILGSEGGDGRMSVPATLAGFVTDEGAMTDWPADQFVRFTPTGGTRRAPTVQVSAAGHALLHQSVAVASPGDSIAGLNLTINLDDADGDAVLVRAQVTASPSTNVIANEFSSGAAPVPYALQPSSGSLPDFTYVSVLLRVHDGQDGIRTFVFYLRANNSPPPSRPSGHFILSPLAEIVLSLAVAGMKGGCVASEGMPSGSVLALAALALLAALRRQTVKRSRQRT